MSVINGEFGIDVMCLPDLDGTFTLVSDGRVLCEAVARRLMTPRGSLPFHPDYGFDVRSYLNESMSADDVYRFKSSVERECEADERVASADASVSFEANSSRLRLSVIVTTASGEYRFTLLVTQLTTELLLEA